MPFPEREDRELQTRATQLEELASGFGDWIVEHQESYKAAHRAFPEDLPSSVLHISRRARQLRVAVSVPVATAIYGASGSGKSLLLGRLVGQSLGLVAGQGTPVIDFARDINPRTSVEATAVVTRFSPADRCDVPEGMRDAPVRGRIFSLAEIMKALGRGFLKQCRGSIKWDESAVTALFQGNLLERSERVDLEWRADIIDTYRYLKEDQDNKWLVCSPQVLDSLLLRFKPSDAGYWLLACHLFWENWSQISDLFRSLRETRQKLSNADCVYLPWQAVRFILDSSRQPNCERSIPFGDLSWTDISLVRADKASAVFAYKQSGDSVDLCYLQGILAELQLPILVDRLDVACQTLFEKGDCLDIPGAVAPGDGRSKWRQEDLKAEPGFVLDVLKRGKVGFLIEKYSEELQASTLVYLQKKGQLDASAELGPQLAHWGVCKFKDKWPRELPAREKSHPSLFVCFTHLHDFIRMEVSSGMWCNWIDQAVKSFHSWFKHYGKRDTPFQNCHFLRYGDSLDKAPLKPAAMEASKVEFMKSPKVETYVKDKEQKWESAFGSDGGLELLVGAITFRLENDNRRDMLASRLHSLAGELNSLMSKLYVDPDEVRETTARRAVANAVTEWLNCDETGEVTSAMIDTLHCEGSIIEDAIRDVQGPQGVGDVVGMDCRQVVLTTLEKWLATRQEKWDFLARIEKTNGNPSIDAQTLTRFGRYIVDYLRSDGGECISQMAVALNGLVMHLSTPANPSGDMRYISRYSEMAFDDYLSNPGPRVGVFAAEDILDLPSLSDRLNRKSDPVSQFLMSRFSAETVQLLSRPHSDAKVVKVAVAREVMRLIEIELIYEQRRFAEVNLSEETRAGLQQAPEGEVLMLLNRLLLEDAYPTEIRRSQLGNLAPHIHLVRRWERVLEERLASGVSGGVNAEPVGNPQLSKLMGVGRALAERE